MLPSFPRIRAVVLQIIKQWQWDFFWVMSLIWKASIDSRGSVNLRTSNIEQQSDEGEQKDIKNINFHLIISKTSMGGKNSELFTRHLKWINFQFFQLFKISWDIFSVSASISVIFLSHISTQFNVFVDNLKSEKSTFKASSIGIDVDSW